MRKYILLIGLIVIFLASLIFAREIGDLFVRNLSVANTATVSNGSFTTIAISTATITNTLSAKVVDLAVNLDTASAPSSTGILGLTSAFKLYVSTGTAAGQWALVGSQS